MNLVIRRATQDDYKGKGYVRWKSWHETYTGKFSDEVMKNIKLERCQQMAYDYPQNTYVAIVDERIVGFSCWVDSRDEDLPNAGEINAIYILKEYQGLGIGKKLMKLCYNELSKYDSIILWVLEDNIDSIKFYESQGFIREGKRKKHHEKIVIRMIKSDKK